MGFKMFPQALRIILGEFELKPSQGDPIRIQNYGFETYDMCCVET